MPVIDLDDLEALGEPPVDYPIFPFLLSAGERRSFTANTILRDPRWRKRDIERALRIAPIDAARLGLADGDTATLTTHRATITVAISIDHSMQAGHLALPNGLGLDHLDGENRTTTGIAPNELTASGHRDPWAGTPGTRRFPPASQQSSLIHHHPNIRDDTSNRATMQLNGAVALVTGANRGIGAALTQALLAAGAAKVYAAARTPGRIDNTDVTPIRIDVTSSTDIAAAADACRDVTLLINNAGIGSAMSALSARAETVDATSSTPTSSVCSV